MTSLSLITRIEAATFTAWPAITTAMDGRWLARFARGFTKRSNSIQCLDPADDGDAVDRLWRLADLYPLNSLDPIFRVTPLAGPGVIAALDAEGWRPYEESRVLTMSLAEIRRCPRGSMCSTARMAAISTVLSNSPGTIGVRGRRSPRSSS